MSEYKSEVRDGMRIDWDAPIEMDDGVVLRCDVYRPDDDGHYPVIMSYGPYAKWLHLQDGYPHQWSLMVNDYPETIMGTSNKYQNWELVTPRNGCRTVTPACGWIQGVLPARRAISRCGRRARPGIFTTASNGREGSSGATGRWG